jgi:hypothetical protein
MGVWKGMAMDGSLRPAMPNPSTPCGWATPETAVMQGRWSVAFFYPIGHPTSYAYAEVKRWSASLLFSANGVGFFVVAFSLHYSVILFEE